MTVTLEPLDLDRDLAVLHAWVTHPRSAFWMMQDHTPEQVRAAYAEIVASPHHDAWLGRVDGVPAFLAETYDPARSELAPHHETLPGDLGMHVLVGPPAGAPVPGFTSRVFAAVMRHCFASRGHGEVPTQRVVVEPDVRNEAIAALNARAGFLVVRDVPLEGKTAALSVCTRERFASSPLGRQEVATVEELDLAEHLEPEAMALAHRMLVRKALAELSHERLIDPTPVTDAPGFFEVVAGESTYRFHAHRHELEHWVVDPWSITRSVDGATAEPDVLELVASLHAELGLPEHLVAVYLEELNATLASSAWKQHHRRASATELLEADFQTIEGSMTEGHPAFIANNGRIGFDVEDYRRFAPETGSDVRLAWVALRRTHARLTCGAGLDEETLLAGELDRSTRDAFDARLRSLGLEPDDYLLAPVHPWQWRHKLAVTFATDVARRDVVPLGLGPDTYRAQQSIRTFFNTTRPDRHYVKTALSIQNMGFMRGLSPHYMEATPAINDWVHDLVAGDDELRDRGFEVLRERAAVGYTGGVYQRLGARTAYQKMLAALWRESPVERVGPGERLATMASLLHHDQQGRSYAAALVRASGLAPEEWVRRYLDVYLRPLVHCLWAHDLAFMPHGENVILVLRDHVPVRALMKDIGEEVAVLGDGPLPEAVERIRAKVPEDVRALSILTDVVDGFLRFLAADLAEEDVLPADSFWTIAARCVAGLLEDHPEHAEAARRDDVLAEEFAHSCLNRLQLRNTLEMVDLSDQASSLAFAGVLRNPMAGRA